MKCLFNSAHSWALEDYIYCLMGDVGILNLTRIYLDLIIKNKMVTHP